MKHTLTPPANWPADAPPYYSKEGWEFEKAMALKRLKQKLNIK